MPIGMLIGVLMGLFFVSCVAVTGNSKPQPGESEAARISAAVLVYVAAMIALSSFLGLIGIAIELIVVHLL